MMLFGDNIEIDVHFDKGINKFRIKDTFGEFLPIPIPMWQHCIEKPYEVMKQNGTTIERVLEIFMSDYSYLYVCKN